MKSIITFKKPKSYRATVHWYAYWFNRVDRSNEEVALFRTKSDAIKWAKEQNPTPEDPINIDWFDPSNVRDRPRSKGILHDFRKLPLQELEDSFGQCQTASERETWRTIVSRDIRRLLRGRRVYASEWPTLQRCGFRRCDFN